jgi:hypothetical protein
MAGRKTTKKAPSSGAAGSYDLNETVTIRISQGLLEYVDWYAGVLSERDQVNVLRPEAIRQMILYAGRALMKAEGVK